MSGECDKCGEHSLECKCTLDTLANTYWKPADWQPPDNCSLKDKKIFQDKFTCKDWFGSELKRIKDNHLHCLNSKKGNFIGIKESECAQFYDSYVKEFGEEYVEKDNEEIRKLDEKENEKEFEEYCRQLEWFNSRCLCYQRYLEESHDK